MTTAFVDTSALYALLDESDENHERATEWLSNEASSPEVVLSSHTYVVIETAALVQRRLGADATHTLFDGLLPTLSVVAVDGELHRAGVASYRAGLRRGSSLVDHVSFEFMRWRGISETFAFDNDFAKEGFRLVPS